eukprot:TRINITY_DN55124_c0_g1_i1.p1 TRINITY_DN55124_c0_g1~~TRINITY_DN55124_c0_g1_i1.p1  ORF type:complete len:112 (+),score=31.04 TRINITY_DN55124_c0_g1_i1:51-338(+)
MAFSSYERAELRDLKQEDEYESALHHSGDDVKAMRLQRYKEESSNWPPAPEGAESKEYERLKQQKLLRDKFDPDHFHLRPTLPGGPEADTGLKKK